MALTLSPLWIFRYVPGVDYPIHLATGRILADLITDNALSSVHYQFNVQLTPYWLLYVLLTPLVYLFGADIGGAILLTAIGVGFFGAIWNLIRLLDLSPACLIPAVCWFYHASFFWGFLTSFVAVPIILWGGVFLLRLQQSHSRQDLVLAMLCACLVSFSNVLMTVPMFCVVLAWGFLDIGKNWRPMLLVGAASALPFIPWAVFSLDAMFTSVASGGESVLLEYAPPIVMLQHVDQQFRIFGDPLGYLAEYAMLLLVLTHIVIGFRRTAIQGTGGIGAWFRQHRFAAQMFLFSAVTYFATPIGVYTVTDVAWGINFRYFTFVGVALILLGPKRQHSGVEQGPGGLVAKLMSVTALMYLSALFGFWYAFDVVLRDIEPALDAMEPGRRLGIAYQSERFTNAVPPVGLHVPSYSVARKGGMNNAIFSGGHAPIKISENLNAEMEDYSSLRIGDFDYMLMQRRQAIRENAEPEDGVLIAETEYWRLYSKRRPRLR